MPDFDRTAACCCGEISVTFRGEPQEIIRCHCKYCQRRTGSVFQISAWYGADQIVSEQGDGTIFNDSKNNPGVDYAFCPRCGSTVYWPVRLFPGLYGVAAGCFADANFPAPTLEIHERHRHPWVPLMKDVPSYREWPEFMIEDAAKVGATLHREEADE